MQGKSTEKELKIARGEIETSYFLRIPLNYCPNVFVAFVVCVSEIRGKRCIVSGEIYVGICFVRKVGKLPAFFCFSKQLGESKWAQEIGDHGTVVAFELSAGCRKNFLVKWFARVIKRVVRSVDKQQSRLGVCSFTARPFRQYCPWVTVVTHIILFSDSRCSQFDNVAVRVTKVD